MKLSLKSQNLPLLTIFTIVLGASLVWAVNGRFTTADIISLDGYRNSAIFLGLSTILTLLLSELVPRNVKLTIVYWRIKNPAPGSRAFSKIAPNDHRIDIAVLVQKFGAIPIDPKEQDRLFYKIYKPLDDEISVKDAHKSFLLFRDMSVISLISAVFGGVAVIFLSKAIMPAAIFLAANGFAFIATAIAAQNAGVRFVANSLAVACITRPSPLASGAI